MNQILEGNISIKAAILANQRVIQQIMVEKKRYSRDTRFILKQASQRNIKINECSRADIDALASGKTHGGMIAICEERSYQNLSDYETKDSAFLALLEGIEDPFNFGYVIRALYAAGCEGIIVPPRNWNSAAGVVTKASAGASEYMNMIIAHDLKETVDVCKKQQFSIVCALRSAHSLNVYDYTFPRKMILAIGGELRGLSKVVIEASDQDIYIPYANDFRNAMTAAGSAAILGFERLRQQLKQKTL